MSGATRSVPLLDAKRIQRLTALHSQSAPEFGGECADVRCAQPWPCEMAAAMTTIHNLAKYARHMDNCSAYRPYPTGTPAPCSCGFAALSAYREVNRG